VARRIHHAVYCFAPDHLDEARSFWQDGLGVALSEVTANPALRIFHSPEAGIELIAPVPGVPGLHPRIAAFVESGREGLYTLVFEVDDLDGAEAGATAHGTTVERRLSFPAGDHLDLSEQYGMRVTLAHHRDPGAG